MLETILIADDEAMVRNVFVALITQMGFECLQAENGEEAIYLLKKEKSIKLLLMDINMPKIDGLTALKEIRDYYSDLHIIMMTGDCQKYCLNTILRAGGNDLIYKPIELDKLKKKIEFFLKLTP